MHAAGNHTSNDSVHVQFSDSVDASGAALARIGTTSSLEPVLQDGPSGPSPHEWGWAQTGWGSPGPPVYFAAPGTHVVRVQRCEDGAAIDQIVLSADTYLTTAPGPRRDDTTILPSTDGTSLPPPATIDTIVLWTGDTERESTAGNWQLETLADAAGGTALRNPNSGEAKIAPARAAPTTYFDMTFSAKAGLPYHIWIRARADGNSTSNDSVHVQFDDAVDSGGAPFARIGTTASAEFVLQDGTGGPAPQEWGWTENGWGAFGPHAYFGATGTHRIRVQQREDGITVDQIVISADAYLTNAPGTRRNDATILPRTAGSTANQPPTVSLTAPADGATFTAPADIAIAATASDHEGQLSRVDFYQGSTLLGSDTTEPFGFIWTGAPAGSYTIVARPSTRPAPKRRHHPLPSRSTRRINRLL